MSFFGPTRQGAVRARLLRAPWRALLLAGLVLSAARCDKSEASALAEKSPPPAPRAPAGRCGDKGLPDCPTQAWMKATLQPFVLAGDNDRLVEALEKLAAAAPAGYDDWAAISRSAAKAAKAGDMANVKASCTECHGKHRARFRAEIRQKPLF